MVEHQPIAVNYITPVIADTKEMTVVGNNPSCVRRHAPQDQSEIYLHSETRQPVPAVSQRLEARSLSHSVLVSGGGTHRATRGGRRARQERWIERETHRAAERR
jgi:hypothetical protein